MVSVQKKKLKLLVGVVWCVAAVVAVIILRGRGQPSARRAGSAVLSYPPASSVGSVTENRTTVAALGNPLIPNSAPASAVLQKLAGELARYYVSGTPDEREQALRRTVEGVPATEIPTLLQALAVTTLHPLNSELRLALVSRWVQAEPAAAAAWVESNLGDGLRQQALSAVAVAWSTTDVEAVAKWARQLREPQERHGVLTALAYEVSGENPSAAATLAAELPSDKLTGDLVARIATLWGGEFSPEVISWSSRLPTDALRQQAIAAVATAWAENDPASAGKLAAETLTGRMREEAILAVVQRWTQQEPQKAAEWVTRFPEGELRDTAVEELIKLWTAADVQNAGRWLSDLSPGPTRDVAVSAYAGAIAPAFPQLAAEWANHILDETLRLDEIERIAEIWLSGDSTAARQWLAQVPLPPERKARLLAGKTP